MNVNVRHKQTNFDHILSLFPCFKECNNAVINFLQVPVRCYFSRSVVTDTFGQNIFRGQTYDLLFGYGLHEIKYSQNSPTTKISCRVCPAIVTDVVGVMCSINCHKLIFKIIHLTFNQHCDCQLPDIGNYEGITRQRPRPSRVHIEQALYRLKLNRCGAVIRDELWGLSRFYQRSFIMVTDFMHDLVANDQNLWTDGRPIEIHDHCGFFVRCLPLTMYLSEMTK